MRLKRKSENFINVKICTNVNNNYIEFIDNENLKTKVYESKRNKKPYAKELKYLFKDKLKIPKLDHFRG